MVSLFKRNGRGPYLMKFRENGRMREVSTRTTDKAVARRIANGQAERLALKKAGLVSAAAELAAEQDKRDVLKHVQEYIDACTRAGQMARNLTCKKLHLERFVEHARASRLSELTPEALDLFLGSLATPAGDASEATEDSAKSARTINSHRQDAVAFMEWCRKNGRVAENRLGIVPKRNEDRDRRRIRRPLTDEELTKLLTAAEARGRRLWYAAAALAGLRKGDLKTLRWADVDFDEKTLTVRGGKAKRADVLPLHPQLLEELRSARPENVHPQTRVFATVVTDATRQRDFKRAGIALEDEDGRVADLHALRTTLGTRLARAGVTPQLAQKLMRHADYRTTQRHYTVLGLQDAAKALASVPGIAPPADATLEVQVVNAEFADPHQNPHHFPHQVTRDEGNSGAPRSDDGGETEVPPPSASRLSSHFGATQRDDVRGVDWYTRRDSNAKPSAPEADALSN